MSHRGKVGIRCEQLRDLRKGFLRNVRRRVQVGDENEDSTSLVWRLMNQTTADDGSDSQFDHTADCGRTHFE